jgi:hypothetical protein
VTGVTYRDAPYNTGTSRDGTARRYRRVCHAPSRRHAVTGRPLCSECTEAAEKIGVCRSGAST